MDQSQRPEARLMDNDLRANIKAFLVRAELLTQELHEVSGETLRDLDLNSVLMAALTYEIHELREQLGRLNG